MFLVTRPQQMATREQVFDQLWPDQDPVAAANSLHQTLYFLRRDIDPWYEDGLSVDYSAMKSEVVYLDPELVQARSVVFQRQASDVLARGAAPDEGRRLLRHYEGKFAPEFEYEEWAMAWRDRLHALYLQLVQSTAEGLLQRGDHEGASTVISAALLVDSSALELEPTLVRALWWSGARAAAVEQYSHYSRLHAQDLGLIPPSFTDLLAGAT